MQNDTFYVRNIIHVKTVPFANTSIFNNTLAGSDPNFVLNHDSNAETRVFNQIVCILACSKQNNTFYTINLIHAKRCNFPIQAF